MSVAVTMEVRSLILDFTLYATRGVTGGVVLGLTFLNPVPIKPVAEVDAEVGLVVFAAAATPTIALTGVAAPLLDILAIPAISSSLLTIVTTPAAAICILGDDIIPLAGECILGVSMSAEGDCEPGVERR